MARTQAFYARVEPELKAKAEVILAQLGMSSSDAVNIFLSQVVLKEGLPFDVKLPRPTKDEAIEWLMTEVQKGEDSLKNEPLMSLEESRKLLGV
ncbi:MAG: type II toxin-antitoxin system RelB/DinJ family antitoxin [Firmicutes bacterium]|nr:type II toxin-antitoxin system RelB/DinJ family antitoxin [Bacillota bacterium]